MDEQLFLGLGSNLAGVAGDAEAQLRWAIAELRSTWGTVHVAPLYRTAPVSSVPQGDFLNTVVKIETFDSRLSGARPIEILEQLQDLERRAGRRSGVRWGPRALDIDLLLWGDQRIETSRLTVPHPRLRLRRFVLVPLVDLAPELRLPPDGARVEDVLAELERTAEGAGQHIEKLRWTSV